MQEIVLLLDEHNGRTRAMLVRLGARVARRRGRWRRRKSLRPNPELHDEAAEGASEKGAEGAAQ